MSGHFIATVKEVVKQVQEDDCLGMAAEMAYNLMLASAPSFIFLVAVLGLIGSQDAVLNQVYYYAAQVIPGDAMGMLRGLLDTIVTGSSEGLALFGLLGTLWAASNGAMVILKGLNRAYGYKDKNSFIRQRLVAIFIVLSLGVTLIVGANLVVFGDLLLGLAAEYLNIHATHIAIASTLRWILALLLIIAFSTFVYKRAPGPFEESLTWQRTLPGGTVYALLWIGISIGFSYYVENMGTYNQVYGALGAVIVLMIWLYLSSLAFLVGGEVNAVLEERYAQQTGKRITQSAKAKAAGMQAPQPS